MTDDTYSHTTPTGHYRGVRQLGEQHGHRWLLNEGERMKVRGRDGQERTVTMTKDVWRTVDTEEEAPAWVDKIR